MPVQVTKQHQPRVRLPPVPARQRSQLPRLRMPMVPMEIMESMEAMAVTRRKSRSSFEILRRLVARY